MRWTIPLHAFVVVIGSPPVSRIERSEGPCVLRARMPRRGVAWPPPSSRVPPNIQLFMQPSPQPHAPAQNALNWHCRHQQCRDDEHRGHCSSIRSLELLPLFWVASGAQIVSGDGSNGDPSTSCSSGFRTERLLPLEARVGGRGRWRKTTEGSYYGTLTSQPC